MKLDEYIVRTGSHWTVMSEKGRRMGSYDTKAEAAKRLRQIEAFKHMKESEFDQNPAKPLAMVGVRKLEPGEDANSIKNSARRIGIDTNSINKAANDLLKPKNSNVVSGGKVAPENESLESIVDKLVEGSISLKDAMAMVDRID